MKEQILKYSYENKMSHLGSNLSAVDIIDAIYQVKAADEKFILSSGHAHLAHAFVADLEKGVHCDRELGCDVSTGSLGQGLPIAVGMALANRERKVWCVISDGECSEGSIWEALRVGGEQKLTNLKVVCNANQWAAYKDVNPVELVDRFRSFGWGVVNADGHDIDDLKAAISRSVPDVPIIVLAHTTVEHHPALKGQDAHYHVLTKEEYGKS